MQSNLRVAKYQPLTFQCVHCDQQFVASGNSLEQVGADVSEHINKNHPEVLRADLQQRVA
jgi:hypothetical protein